jgi:ribosomal protein L11 methyltransferase
MKYIEVTITMDDTGVFRDLLVDALGNEGPYDSFVETSDGLKAYVPVNLFDEEWLRQQLQEMRDQFSTFNYQFSIREMEDKDWNEEWERGHEAVLVRSQRGTVWVRASFHPHRTDVDYELIIEPKMSFGTAHHPTTYMMLSYVAELEMEGRRVLDMGCGTAVLAILAKKCGAAMVTGIDVDEWAFANAQENAAANGVEIDLRLGDASLLQSGGVGPFDIIIANINRNILLNDMDRYAAALAPGGTLLLSGFYEADEEALIAKANTLGMVLESKKNREGWSALQLRVKN